METHKSRTLGTIFLLPLLIVGLCTAHFAHAATLATYNFNTAGDLTTYFNNDAGEAYTESSNGGIGDTRSVSVFGQEGIYAAKAGYGPLSTGQTLTESAYFFNNGTDGYGSLGFVDASPSNGTTGVPTAHNLSVRFHGGGGDLYHNNTTAANFNFVGPDLENATWYRVIFSITKEATTDSYSADVQIWKSDSTGALISQKFDGPVNGFVNADLAGKTLYPFFGTGGTNRMSHIDNVEITDSAFIPGPAPLAGSGTQNDPWQVTECMTITDSGYYEIQNAIPDFSGTCINIQASNVTLDGANYTLSGESASEDIGVLVENRDNVVIKNTEVTNVDNAIVGRGVTHMTITNNTILDAVGDSILVEEFEGEGVVTNDTVTISNNIISRDSESDGVQLVRNFSRNYYG
jgi:hypothetical protein